MMGDHLVVRLPFLVRLRRTGGNEWQEESVV